MRLAPRVTLLALWRGGAAVSDELRRIICVEDEPDIRALTELALTRMGGFELDVCASGAEALERIPAFEPDLILLDVMMPDMHGPELLRKLKADPELRDIPVVFMTAKAQEHEQDAYRMLGAAGVIPKPFELMTLSDDVRAIWDRVRERNSP